MNPYLYLREGLFGTQGVTGYKYIEDGQLRIGDNVRLGRELGKVHAEDNLLKDAFDPPGYFMQRENESAINHATASRYLDIWTYEQLRNDFDEFLRGEQYAIPGNAGPPSRETLLIVESLRRIIAAGFVTWDSQPGIVVEQQNRNRYIQIPYLHLSGPPDQLQALLTRLNGILYEGQQPVLLVDRQTYDWRRERSAGRAPVAMVHGDGLRLVPTYMRGFACTALASAIQDHEVVMLAANPPYWYLPFFSIIEHAVAHQSLSEGNINDLMRSY